jgi:hypothetical protein
MYPVELPERFQGGSFLLSTVSASLNVPESSYELIVGDPLSVAVHHLAPTVIVELGDVAKRFELELLGTLSVALNREVLNKSVARFIRSEGGSAQLIHAALSLSASGFTSTHLPTDAPVALARAREDLEARSSRDVIRNIARTSEGGLDPSVSFLLMFTSLEQLLKDQAPRRLDTRRRLIWFLSVVNLAGDGDELMRLYEVRNRLAHEGELATSQDVADLRAVLSRVARAAP